MTFYTLINYFRKLLDFFWLLHSGMYKLKQSIVHVPGKKVLLKFKNIRRDDIDDIDLDDNKNVQKLL